MADAKSTREDNHAAYCGIPPERETEPAKKSAEVFCIEGIPWIQGKIWMRKTRNLDEKPRLVGWRYVIKVAKLQFLSCCGGELWLLDSRRFRSLTKRNSRVTYERAWREDFSQETKEIVFQSFPQIYFLGGVCHDSAKSCLS